MLGCCDVDRGLALATGEPRRLRTPLVPARAAPTRTWPRLGVRRMVPFMTNEANAARSIELENSERGAAHGYTGPERRRHRVYITRNTEYHVRDTCCVAVRDRRTGEFLHGHLAIDRRVEGGLRFFDNGAIAPNPGEPRRGESIYFAGDGRELVTSPLEATERPSPEMVSDYPAPRSHSGSKRLSGRAGR